MSVDGDTHWPAVLAVAMLACLISDSFWFRAGRFTASASSLLCKISLSPDYCVSQTEDNSTAGGRRR
jgi:membrane protein DedA with SNARE-associated domain